MTNDSKDEKPGKQAFDAKAELEAEAVVGTGELGPASGGGGPAPSPSGDSPKPHGDKLGHAVREAADTPPKDKG